MATTVIPSLTVQGAASAIEFYKQAFGATEVLRLMDPSGKIGHAEIRIGESRIMLADEFPEYGVLGPQSRGGASSALALDVAHVDAAVDRAVAAGARLINPVTDQFYGERSGKLEDPFGHIWYVSTRTEELSQEEMQRRYDAL